MENFLTVLKTILKELSQLTHIIRELHRLKKHSENILVSTNSYGKNMLKFIGPRVFNEIVDLDFYKRCNTKVGFKTNLKKISFGSLKFLHSPYFLFTAPPPDNLNLC